MSQNPAAPVANSPLIVIVLAFLVGVCQGFDLQVPSVTATALRGTFGLSAAQLGSFFSAATLGVLFGAAGGGALSDRIGRKLTLALATFCFGVGSLATGWATDLQMLFFSRLVTGIGMGAAFTNLIAITSESVSPERRGRAVAMVMAGMNIGGAIVCLLSALNPSLTNWRLLYHAGGIAPLLMVPAILLLLPATRPDTRSAKQEKARIADLFGRERGMATAMLWLASFLLMISIYLLASWLPSLLQGRGVEAGMAAAVQVVFNLAGIAGAALSGWLLDRPPARRSVGIAALYTGYLVSILALAIVPPQIALIFVLGGLVGAMMTAVASVLYALAPALYPPHIRGTGIGLGIAAGRVGSIIGPIFAGLLLSTGYSASWVLVAMVPLTAMAAICAVMLARTVGRATLA